MSRTPERMTNKFAQFCRNALILFGIFCALAALGNYQNEGNVFLPAILSLGSFILAAKLKVHWDKRGEVGVYK